MNRLSAVLRPERGGGIRQVFDLDVQRWTHNRKGTFDNYLHFRGMKMTEVGDLQQEACSYRFCILGRSDTLMNRKSMARNGMPLAICLSRDKRLCK